MEKRHLEIPVNGKHQDCIISHFMKATKDINGNVKWVNVNDCIAETQGAVDEITLYVQDDNDCKKFSAVKLNTHSIKTLYAHIMEIESRHDKEFVEP